MQERWDISAFSRSMYTNISSQVRAESLLLRMMLFMLAFAGALIMVSLRVDPLALIFG